MTNIFFVRHAQSDDSVESEKNRPLTEKGKLDSQKLASVFQRERIHFIFSSPLKRAIDTITPLSQSKRIEIEIINNLQERKIGFFFHTAYEFQEFVKRQWFDFTYKLPNGECLKEVQSRNIQFVNYLLSLKGDHTAVIGTHGTSLCTILNYFDSSCGYEYFMSIADLMPLIIKVQFQDDQVYKIERLPC